MRLPVVSGAIAALIATLAGLYVASGSAAAYPGRTLFDPAWSPDGKQIAFADADEGRVGRRGDLTS